MTQFADLGLAEPILRAVSAGGYSHPTPIQAEAIPVIKSGRDVVGIAQTGTGKTAAFVLPLLDTISRERRRSARKTSKALVLVPTRELAAQVAASIRSHACFMRVSTAIVVGGAKAGPQIKALAGGVDIVVATPGRLEDHLATGALSLDGTGTVILDEADQMLDLGFVPAVRRILAKVSSPRQTVLLSATMPRAIRSLAQDFLDRPVEVSVAPQARPIDQIDQRVVHLDPASKRDRLVEILGDAAVTRAIVFTRTKRGADRVNQHLERAGLRALAIHGNKSQSQRDRALAAFKNGKVSMLVATDIAARGIDIDDVSHVVNFELPNVPEAYVHRIGRTARAGKSGIAISLCAPDEARQLRDIERLIGRRLPSSGSPPGGLKTAHKTTRHRRRKPAPHRGSGRSSVVSLSAS